MTSQLLKSLLLADQNVVQAWIEDDVVVFVTKGSPDNPEDPLNQLSNNTIIALAHREVYQNEVEGTYNEFMVSA